MTSRNPESTKREEEKADASRLKKQESSARRPVKSACGSNRTKFTELCKCDTKTARVADWLIEPSY